MSDEVTFSAKQVATKLNTDAKTIRKFFRSAASTTEAVGQGGRYEFLESDLPQIKEEFEKWNSGQSRRAPKAEGDDTPTPKKSRSKKAAVEELVELEDDDELLDLDDDEDLTPEVIDEEPEEAPKPKRSRKKKEPEPTDEELMGIEEGDIEDLDF
jgi:hypothetical protein